MDGGRPKGFHTKPRPPAPGMGLSGFIASLAAVLAVAVAVALFFFLWALRRRQRSRQWRRGKGNALAQPIVDAEAVFDSDGRRGRLGARRALPFPLSLLPLDASAAGRPPLYAQDNGRGGFAFGLDLAGLWGSRGSAPNWAPPGEELAVDAVVYEAGSAVPPGPAGPRFLATTASGKHLQVVVRTATMQLQQHTSGQQQQQHHHHAHPQPSLARVVSGGERDLEAAAASRQHVWDGGAAGSAAASARPPAAAVSRLGSRGLQAQSATQVEVEVPYDPHPAAPRTPAAEAGVATGGGALPQRAGIVGGPVPQPAPAALSAAGARGGSGPGRSADDVRVAADSPGGSPGGGGGGGGTGADAGIPGGFQRHSDANEGSGAQRAAAAGGRHHSEGSHLGASRGGGASSGGGGGHSVSDGETVADAGASGGSPTANPPRGGDNDPAVAWYSRALHRQVAAAATAAQTTTSGAPKAHQA